MQWAEALTSGMFQGADQYGRPVERAGLQELFAEIAARDAAARARAEVTDLLKLRARRLAAITGRIRAEEGGRQVRRGAARRVALLHVCDSSGRPSYTPVDAEGRPPVFRTATAAGASIDRACDEVCQAIRNSGRVAGRQFAYVEDLPPMHPHFERRAKAPRESLIRMAHRAVVLGHD